jgi:hypothetical protein
VRAVGGTERPSAPEGTSGAKGTTPVGRRDFGLAEEIARVERAALDWGVHVDAAEGQFVRALLKAIEETGRTNLAALGDLEALLATARREGEADRRRIERMIEAGSNALAMTHQATERAGFASIRAEEAIEESIARIAKEMSRALLAESQKWLVLKQTERNRREAWRLAAWVTAAALAIFIAGCATTGWWSARESATRQAVLEAVDRCWVGPMMVRMTDGKTVEACRLADLTTNRPN